MTGPAPSEFGWWLASRAAGLTAMAAMTVAVVLGLLMATGLPLKRRGAKRVVLAIHEHASITALVMTAVHGITLLGDRWLDPGLIGIAVPFVIDHEPLFTGLGVIAGWLAGGAALAFHLKRRLGPRGWRRVHRLSILAYALAVAHTLCSGTDAGSGWLRAALFAGAACVLFLLVVRVLPRSLDAPKEPAST